MTMPDNAQPISPELTDLPSWLETPSNNAPPPPLQPRAQSLPFNEMEWEDFEKLCLRLVKREPDVEHGQIYGTPGQDQEGIDLYARESISEKYRVYQCKREKSFGPAKIRSAVEKFELGKWAPKTSMLVLCTMESLRSVDRVEELERHATRLRGQNIKLIPWDKEELTERLKSQPDIVDDFFGREWVRVFVGEDAAEALRSRNRIDVRRVADLRIKLAKLYSVVFHKQDPGPLIESTGDASGATIADRFVEPDIEETGVDISTSDKRSNNDGDIIELSASSPEGYDPHTSSINQVSARATAQVYRQRLRAGEWLAEQMWSIVLGNPGAGKSTLLRFVALDLLRRSPVLLPVARRWGSFLPIWIPFALWTNLIDDRTTSHAALRDVVQMWLRMWGEEQIWPLVNEALEDGRIILLVDGLDEWTSRQSAQIALQRLQVFAENRQVPAILTSRPHGFRLLGTPTTGWHLGAIGDLSTEQQLTLCRFWFRRHPSVADIPEKDIERQTIDLARGFLKHVERSSDLRELANTPLVLLLLVYLWIHEEVLPQNRFRAYDKLVSFLIITHPARRRTASQIAESDVAQESTIRSSLVHLALTIHTRYPTGGIPEKEATKAIEKHLMDEEYGQGLSVDSARRQSSLIIRFASDSSGILVRRSSDELGFYHRVFQEYLTAEAVSMRPLEEQTQLITERCVDPQWYEVILCIFYLTRRRDDIKRLVDTIQKRDSSVIDKYIIQLLLAEVAFGPFDCPPPLAREIASGTFNEIELGHWRSHRERLLGIAIAGLRSSHVKDLAISKIASWIPDQFRWKEYVYEAIGTWPRSSAAIECAWRGIHSEPINAARAAARAFCRLVGNDEEQQSRLFDVARYHPAAHIRAVAVDAIIDTWSEHPDTPEVVTSAFSSRSPDLHAAAIKGHIIRGEQTSKDFEYLFQHGLANDEISIFKSREQLPHLIAKGWAGSALVKEQCTIFWNAGSEHFPSHRQAVLTTLICCCPQDDSVASLLASEIDTQEYPFAHGGLEVWRHVARNFCGNNNIVHSIEKWLLKQEHNDHEMASAALAARTDTAKKFLLSRLSKGGYIHWIAGALVEGWGMDDPDVAQALNDLAWGPTSSASRLGSVLTKIVLDGEQCRHRLVDLLNDATCDRPGILLGELANVNAIDESIISAALDALNRTVGLERSEMLDELIIGCSKDRRVRSLALGELRKLDGHIGAVAKAYGSDDEISQQILSRLQALPSNLRTNLAEQLGESFGRERGVRDILSRYDIESDTHVRTQMSISYYSSGVADVAREVERLSTDAKTHRSVIGAPRQAAFAGFLVLSKLDVFRTMKEPDWSRMDPSRGESGPLTLTVHVDFGEVNHALAKCIVHHWNYLKQELGEDFWVRLCDGHAHELPRLIESISPFVRSGGRVGEDVAKLLDESPKRIAGPNTLLCLRRLRPRSRLLLDYCMHAIGVRGSNNDLNTMFGAWITAGELLGQEFADDGDVLAELNRPFLTQNKLFWGSVLALCVGWPDNDILQSIFDLIRNRHTPDSLNPAAYFALVCAKSKADVVLRAITSRVRSGSSLRPWQTGTIVRMLVTRIRRDPALLEQLNTHIKSELPASETAGVARLIASAQGVSEELRLWCINGIEQQMGRTASPEIGFDFVFGERRAVMDTLLDVIFPGGIR